MIPSKQDNMNNPIKSQEISSDSSESMKSLYSTPTAAFNALNLQQNQNIDGFHTLLTLLVEKLPETSLKVHNIVIVGLRGVGKSTLALMALAALGFRLLDVEKCVSEHVGMPEALFLEKVTVEQYQQLQFDLVTSAVRMHQGESKIIVMPLTVINSHKLVTYLQNERFDFIINVECEEERILNYLNFEGNERDGISLVQSKFAKFRSLSTHDFFNYFSQPSDWKRNLISIENNQENKEDAELSSYFILKPVEREFIKFLTFLIRGPAAATASAGNLHLRSLFFKGFTNCLNVSIPSDFDELNVKDLIGVDCIELSIDMIQLIKGNLSTSLLTLSQFISRSRRLTNSSVPFVMSIGNSLAEVSSFMKEFSISSSRDAEVVRTDLKNYYLTLLGSAIRLGVDYLSIDLNLCYSDEDNFFLDQKTAPDLLFKLLESLVINAGSTEIIGIMHSDESDFWEKGAFSALELAHALKISIVRLSSTALLIHDNFRVATFQNQLRKLPQFKHLNVCAYNKGPLGRLSKVLNKNLSPVKVHDDSVDSITPKQLLISLFSSFILPELQFYILGQRVSKSYSPLIHGEAYKAIGLSYKFIPYECESFMPHFLNLVKRSNFGGAAVIMPFKLEALQYVDTMSNHVKVIGALNTIVAHRDSDQPDRVISIRGENTDWLGVRITLQDSTSPINTVSPNKSALVVGSGGMSRSAIYALIQLGYQNILLYNRTQTRAQLLADHFNKLSPMVPSKSFTTGELCDSKKDLKFFRVYVLLEQQFMEGILPPGVTSYPMSIVSCVPSSNPDTGELTNILLSGKWFSNPTGGVVLETGYDPLVTPILKRAIEFSTKGWTAVNGLNWLLAQAIAQFEMFTGKQAPVALMKDVVRGIYNRKLQ